MRYSSPSVLDGSITTAKLADSAVTTPKIANFAATQPKLATDSVDQLKLEFDAVVQVKLKTSTTSQSGTVLAGVLVVVALSAFSFFPDIEMAAAVDEQPLIAVGSGAPSGSADSPEFRLKNTTGGDKNYSVAWRRMDA